MRVVSWNLAYRGVAAAEHQGALLRELAADVVLLQEANPNSTGVLRQAAGLDWLIRAVDLRTAMPDDRPARRRGVAIAGRGPQPRSSWLLTECPLPERALFTRVTSGNVTFTAGAYHAPPGVTWGLVKPRQAERCASWLATQAGPLLFGADANTPVLDAIDFADTRTHWHTGDRHLRGEPGDDLLWGPAKVHALDDALRRWLDDRPETLAALRQTTPHGPLAITHRTGRRKNSPGTARRFDSVWISRHWTVREIRHLYDEGLAAGSDHAPVVVDLDFVPDGTQA
ncbi:endonuclease/exonuclease/phosphatase family metal-dependent hydrolase [Actinomadura luteofluorescens]|uniref:Endonuclease/exonuclease/phosphatase family metal-dependent hydrolase n=1 Tax=Actinomadura luteofluorescens TaxID=46163 RepID=A0A7Y9EHU4_9ACTN|nr:endonuclease/exonuclease/phosphatase family protein [Actinomadura luteofluorescens]NYD48063.1 endonuclease/exonuclease/phosphatase family metal-dependent hydrolase [Actinomadura luteofluorescens]